MPEVLGPWWKAAQTFIHWSKLGVWERLLVLVQVDREAVLSPLDLHELQLGRAAMGQAERMACGRHALRKDRPFPYERPLSCRCV